MVYTYEFYGIGVSVRPFEAEWRIDNATVHLAINGDDCEKWTVDCTVSEVEFHSHVEVIADKACRRLCHNILLECKVYPRVNKICPNSLPALQATGTCRQNLELENIVRLQVQPDIQDSIFIDLSYQFLCNAYNVKDAPLRLVLFYVILEREHGGSQDEIDQYLLCEFSEEINHKWFKEVIGKERKEMSGSIYTKLRNMIVHGSRDESNRALHESSVKDKIPEAAARMQEIVEVLLMRKLMPH